MTEISGSLLQSELVALGDEMVSSLGVTPLITAPP